MGKRVNHAYSDLAKPLRSTDRTVLAANRREKPQQQGTVKDTDYDLKVLTYSQRMAGLQERQKELKATANRYAEAKYWLDNLKEQMQSGNALSTDDAIIMRSLVERIIVYDDRLEIRLRVGVVLEQEYE